MRQVVKRFLVLFFITIICINFTISIVNAQSQKIVGYTYDKLGRVVETKYADGSILHYTYDKNGNVLSVTVDNKQTLEEDKTTEDKSDNADKKEDSDKTDNSDSEKEDPGSQTDITDTDKDKDKDKESGNTDNKDNASDSTQSSTVIENTESTENTNVDTVTPDIPVYSVDELGLINAFKRSKPIIKSIKRSKQKDSYYLTVNIANIRKNDVISKIGFQIRYSPNKNFKKYKNVSFNQSKKKKLTTKKFKVIKNKNYYVKARTYFKSKTGKKIYSKFSKVHKIKIAK